MVSLFPLFWILSQHISPSLARGTAGLSAREGPTLHYQSLVIGHALLCVLGFAVLLPAGAILARYMRTFRPWWYTAHWVAQVGIAGPVVVIGVVLGYVANHEYGETPGDDHKKWGTIILALYVLQCAFGAVIHYIKPKNARRRPPQNYLHAIAGIAILILGMYQIHTGYDNEWPIYVGLGPLPNGVNALWIVWCILLVIAYTAGLWFIRKQYKQEADARLRTSHLRVGMGDVATSDDQYKMGNIEGQRL
ncbi:hypothetical protein DFH09DRAFT_1305825 [Mycena vulgaris]|nr:hypothetical protein DFH09DRAFT_1305825 [Mycena vulgaris]